MSRAHETWNLIVDDVEPDDERPPPRLQRAEGTGDLIKKGGGGSGDGPETGDFGDIYHFPTGVLFTVDDKNEEPQMSASAILSQQEDMQFEGQRTPWSLILATHNAVSLTLDGHKSQGIRRNSTVTFDVLGIGRLFEILGSVRAVHDLFRRSSLTPPQRNFMSKLLSGEMLRVSTQKAIIELLGWGNRATSRSYSKLLLNKNDEEGAYFWEMAELLEDALDDPAANIPWIGESMTNFRIALASATAEARRRRSAARKGGGKSNGNGYASIPKDQLLYPIADAAYFAAIEHVIDGRVMVPRGGGKDDDVNGTTAAERLRIAAIHELALLERQRLLPNERDIFDIESRIDNLGRCYKPLDEINGFAIYPSGAVVPSDAYYVSWQQANQELPRKLQFLPFCKEAWLELLVGAPNDGIMMKPDDFDTYIMKPVDKMILTLIQREGTSVFSGGEGLPPTELIIAHINTPAAERKRRYPGNAEQFVELLAFLAERLFSTRRAHLMHQMQEDEAAILASE
ncbi:hypothetical protein COV82_01615 [Candidatus Peregrinibacteria bacterium CG11_big_fil_rev_8_21_14_0_20_46_8]|nr:MAG: hypothetical protein COV82_01615 [Candidatus Peregrinibacteria bacterium CG11_big_fil_rev_8_21_14_0_20_46_8]